MSRTVAGLLLIVSFAVVGLLLVSLAGDQEDHVLQEESWHVEVPALSDDKAFLQKVRNAAHSAALDAVQHKEVAEVSDGANHILANVERERRRSNAQADAIAASTNKALKDASVNSQVLQQVASSLTMQQGMATQVKLKARVQQLQEELHLRDAAIAASRHQKTEDDAVHAARVRELREQAAEVQKHAEADNKAHIQKNIASTAAERKAKQLAAKEHEHLQNTMHQVKQQLLQEQLKAKDIQDSWRQQKKRLLQKFKKAKAASAAFTEAIVQKMKQKAQEGLKHRMLAERKQVQHDHKHVAKLQAQLLSTKSELDQTKQKAQDEMQKRRQAEQSTEKQDHKRVAKLQAQLLSTKSELDQTKQKAQDEMQKRRQAEQSTKKHDQKYAMKLQAQVEYSKWKLNELKFSRSDSGELQSRVAAATTQVQDLQALTTKALSTVHVQYLGCFADHSDDRDFPVSAGPTESPTHCAAKCRSMDEAYNFVAVQRGDRCFCGTSYGRHGREPAATCFMRCSGPKGGESQSPEGSLCGGIHRNSVYSTFLVAPSSKEPTREPST